MANHYYIKIVAGKNAAKAITNANKTGTEKFTKTPLEGGEALFTINSTPLTPAVQKVMDVVAKYAEKHDKPENGVDMLYVCGEDPTLTKRVGNGFTTAFLGTRVHLYRNIKDYAGEVDQYE